MSTLEAPDHFSSTTSWRARVRFVQDLAPRGMGVFMAPQRSMLLRLADSLYMRTPILLVAVAIAWGATTLSLWPAVSLIGLGVWSLFVGAAWGALALLWRRTERPMLRPGASTSWAFEHVAALWLLFLALASGIVLVYPDGSQAHLRALCLIIASVGIVSALCSCTSIRALAAILGPTIGFVALVLIFRGATELAASVSLAGGSATLVALGLFQLSADSARRDVETG